MIERTKTNKETRLMQLDVGELKNELEQANDQYQTLRQQSLDLRDAFKAQYRASICPVFLSRNPDKSLTPLFWRYSSTIKGRRGLRPKAKDFWALISTMNATDRLRLSEFELKRMRINYQLSVVAYKVPRLEQFIDDLSGWENNMRHM